MRGLRQGNGEQGRKDNLQEDIQQKDWQEVQQEELRQGRQENQQQGRQGGLQQGQQENQQQAKLADSREAERGDLRTIMLEEHPQEAVGDAVIDEMQDIEQNAAPTPAEKHRMSRRKLLKAMGLTGVALASSRLLNFGVDRAYAEGGTVTAAVYGLNGRPGPADKPGKPGKPGRPEAGIGWVNVLHYGAHGDGSHDNYGALYQLIDSLSLQGQATLYFPEGIYRIGSSLTLPSWLDLRMDQGAVLSPDAGVVLTVDSAIFVGKRTIFAGGGTVMGTLGGQCLYPQWWGAKGDGVADDRHAIQQALNLAKTNEGISVYLSQGTYKVMDSLRIYRNTKLTLNHKAVIKRFHDNSFLYNGDNGEQYPGYEGHGNLIIEGGVWDGNVADYPDSFAGLNIAHARRVTIRDTTIKDISWGHAIEINASSDVLIEHCRFIGFMNAADGSRYYAEAVQIDVPTSSAFPWFGAYDGTPCEHITVKDCYFGPSGTPGTTSWGGGVGTHTAIHDVWTRNIKVLNNTFDQLGYVAVRLFKYSDCLVQGNTMYQCGGGVAAATPAADSNSTRDKDGIQRGTPQAGERILITDNLIVGTTAYEGISCYGSGDVKLEQVVIANNMITSVLPGKTSIVVTRSSNVQITGNQIEKTRRGIYTENTVFLQIGDNQIETTDFEGIWAAKGSETLISDNRIKEAAKDGIQLTETNNFTIENNFVASSGREAAGTYSGIKLDNAVHHGEVRYNTVRMSPQGNQNRYGLAVTASCSHVVTCHNLLAAAQQAYFNQASSSFDTFSLYAPNGDGYSLFVDNAGALQVQKV